MRNFISFIAVFYDAIIGFVVAFFKEFIAPKKSFDHSGYQSFVEKTQSVALQVKLAVNSWLAGLQHSPTA